MDVAGFLHRYAPFDRLEPERLEAVARSVEIEHFPHGRVILQQAGDPARSLYVVRKGAVALLDEGVLLDLLGEGEVFGQFSLLAHDRPALTVRAEEDTLAYLIPSDVAASVLETPPGVSFMIDTMRRRLSAAAGAIPTDAGDRRYRPVAELIRRPPVTIEPDATVADAAATMAREHVSSLLIPSPNGLGIVTDRDLRSRVVARRSDYETPVRDVATFPARSIPTSMLAGAALLGMFEESVHHFPVTAEDGRVVGVVTDTDLMGLGRHTPFAIRSAIERARDRSEVVVAGRELRPTVVSLVEASADPIDVGRVVALVVDAMTERLLQLGIERSGEAPAAWAWIALGSAARREQALATDQDHAIALRALDSDPAQVDAYFATLAEFVTEGLEAAGIPRCRGDAMAVHPTMRASLDAWVGRFHDWMDDPSFEGSIMSSVGFDFRTVAGSLDADRPLAAAFRDGRTRPRFVRLMARRALSLRPPTGFFRHLVVEARGEHAGRLDVKHGGITIVNNLARAWAIQSGVTQIPTLARLDAVAEAGVVERDLASEIAQAFHFLWDVRLRHQVAQLAAGEPPDDFVDPGALGAVARAGLKEAFRAIGRGQRLLATELGIEMR